jgi:Glycosyltransferases, probably involved in cell wall biogenesis
MKPQVSVVIPTYRRPDYIERCLKALLTQEFPAENFEILVVDDALDQETQQRVEEVRQQAEANGQQGYTIRYIPGQGAHHPNHGPASARNIGWQAAHSEIIAFTDDDCIPEQRWLRTAYAAMQEDIAAIAGRVVTPLPARPTEYEYQVAQVTKRAFASANCFYRRSVLAAVGGFDERFRIPSCEDSDLYFTVLSQYQKCIFLHDAAVMHPVRPTIWGISLRQQQQQMYHALLYKKHPLLYRQHIQAAPPWRYYSSVGVLLIAAIAALSHSWLLSQLACGLWLIMTLFLCWQRLHKTRRTFRHSSEILITSALIPPLAIFWRLWSTLKFHSLFL